MFSLFVLDLSEKNISSGTKKKMKYVSDFAYLSVNHVNYLKNWIMRLNSPSFCV